MLSKYWRAAFFRPENVVFWLVGACVLVAGQLLNYRFIGGIDIDLVGSRGVLDGFNSQIVFVQNLFLSGDYSPLFTSSVYFIHVLRFLVSLPFMSAESLIGSTGSLSLLILLAFPLSRAFRAKNSGALQGLVFSLIRSAPLVIMLLVSGRTMVVALGAGYLVYGLYHVGRTEVFAIILGALLLGMSSGALICGALCVVVILLRMLASKVKFSPKDLLSVSSVFVVLGLLVLPSIQAKFDGFSTGNKGYTTFTEGPANPQYSKPVVEQSVAEVIGIEAQTGPLVFLNRVLTRSTLFVSFAYGQHLRLALYLGMLMSALLYVVWTLSTKRSLKFALPVAALSLGLLLEGAAAWAVLFGLVWAYGTIGSPLDLLFGLGKQVPQENPQS